MIRLGYEIGSGAAVDIPADRHIAVVGQTQMSGKTTTLEALVHRSGLRAVAFVTKRAENSFRDAHAVPPYFSDSADWQFVASILEAMLGERMKFERSWIIDACKGAHGLADILANIKRQLHGVRAPAEFNRKGKKNPEKWLRNPARGLNASVLTTLEAYLDIVIPQIEKLPYTKTLELGAGLSVMDLSEYTTEMQSLVIRSVLEWVYERERRTVVIIPEAWEFIPQNRRSPVLLAAEELIRKGAAAGNYVWLDSQDIAGVHKNVLRSVGVWILGVQREQNETKRTIAYAGAAAKKVRPEEIMRLTRGQFFACFDSTVAKVYVQPFWVGDVHAKAIACGTEKVESAERIWRENRPARGGLSSLIPPPQLLQIMEQTPDEKEADTANEREATAPESGQDGTGVRAGGGGGAIETGDETMWKEKYERLAKSIYEHGIVDSDGIFVPATSPHLPDAAAASPQPPFARPPIGGKSSMDPLAIKHSIEDPHSGYRMLRDCLLADPGVVVALDAARPTIKLQIKRPVLALNGDTLKGRLAKLIHEGFFREPRPAGDVLKECQRRGWLTANNRSNHLAPPMGEIVELGFLTREDAGYLAVKGMKIETVEA